MYVILDIFELGGTVSNLKKLFKIRNCTPVSYDLYYNDF